MHELRTELWLPRPIDEVFAFFAEATNLGTITPPDLRWEFLTAGPIEMRPGALLEYRIRVRGVPIRWRTRIPEWDPPRRFVDEQIKGPYRLWHHTHTFEPEGEGTRCADVVRYDAPGGALVHRMIVKPDLVRIFEFRQARLMERFGGGRLLRGVEIVEVEGARV